MTSTMYAIVCSTNTSALWPTALSRLQEKYESKWPTQVKTITYQYPESKLSSCLPRLSDLRPYYCCFLTHHSECGKAYVQEVHRLTRELDPSHPYTDTVWGILTGFKEEDILFALDQEPLVVKRVLGNCPVDLEKFNSGVWYSEFEQGASYRKTSPNLTPNSGETKKEVCLADTTPLFVSEISTKRRLPSTEDPSDSEEGIDMIISSGHATEDDWNLAYTYRGGKFLCNDGQLYGSTVDGKRADVVSSGKPKILSAAGNCLMGHVSSTDCLALGWMHSANVVQMLGYVEPTWFGYGGWGVHKYFINNPGAMTFSESFFANQQSLIHELHSKYSNHLEASVGGDHRSVYRKCFDTEESAVEGLPRECTGLIYDRDNVAFYGDPAWSAKLLVKKDVYHYISSLSELPASAVNQLMPTSDDHWTYWEYKVVTLVSGQWDCPIPDDHGVNAICPGRPPVCLFPRQLRGVELVRGKGILTSIFLLLPLRGKFDAGREYSVVFRSQTE